METKSLIERADSGILIVKQGLAVNCQTSVQGCFTSKGTNRNKDHGAVGEVSVYIWICCLQQNIQSDRLLLRQKQQSIISYKRYSFIS